MVGKLTLALFFVALAVTGFAAAACGDGDGDAGSSQKSPPATNTRAPAASATSSSGGGNNVTIADFSYNPARFNGRAGQSLRLTVTNAGQQTHTFTITGVVDTGRLGPGEAKVVEFTPAQAGTLVYFCTIHGQPRMSGQLTVAGTAGLLPSTGSDTEMSLSADPIPRNEAA